MQNVFFPDKITENLSNLQFIRFIEEEKYAIFLITNHPCGYGCTAAGRTEDND